MRNPVLDACPNVKGHTKCPDGYVAWHEWAAKKARTHRQSICPGCGLFVIWKPKGRRAGAAEAAASG